MRQNSCFEQYNQDSSKHLALLPPPSAPALPAFLYCFEQFAKNGAQTKRTAFVENKANLGPPWAEVKRVRFLRRIVGQPTNGIVVHFGICSIILKPGCSTIIAKDKATKVANSKHLATIPRVTLATIMGTDKAIKVSKDKGLPTMSRVALPIIYNTHSFRCIVIFAQHLALGVVENSLTLMRELGELVTNGYKRKLHNND